MIMHKKKELSPSEREVLLRTLKTRSEKNMTRHKGFEWAKVQATLESNAEKLWSLYEMERTGGEPDVVAFDKKAAAWRIHFLRLFPTNSRRPQKPLLRP